MGGTCDHDYVFVVGCGAMACIACAQHTSLQNYAAGPKHPLPRRYRDNECNCGWADETKEENDG